MERYLLRIRETLWHSNHGDQPRRAVRTGRYVFVLLRDLLEGQLTMRAMSLVYTTLLSIVPLLALAFSVLKAFGARHALEPFLAQLLAPLGPQAGEVTQQVLGFIQNVKVGVLGLLGIGLLLWSALSLIQKVESSFNFVWRVERPRPLMQRLGEYFAMLTVGPLVIFIAVGVTASVLNSSVVAFLAEYQPFGFLIFVAGRLLPYVLIIALFTLFYRYVPNARVTLRAAAIGGLFAGVLWQTGSLAFASFVAGATNYNAIYSSFAILIFLLIWIYVGWMILLLGCQLAFYVQHPEHLKPRRAPTLPSGRQMEYLALMTMALSGRRFIAGEPGYTEEELSIALGAEPEHVARIVDQLIYDGLLTESGHNRTHLTPAIDLDSVALSRLWALARTGSDLPSSSDPLAKQAVAMIDEAEADFAARHGDLTIRGWLNSQGRG